MHPKHKQSGFSLLAVLALVLALAAVGFASYYVWHKNHTAKQNTAKQEPASTPQKTPKTENKINDPTEGGKYFVIKEWGIRFPQPTPLKGKILYETSNGRSVGETSIEDGMQVTGDMASFTSSELIAQPDNRCELKMMLA